MRTENRLRLFFLIAFWIKQMNITLCTVWELNEYHLSLSDRALMLSCRFTQANIRELEYRYLDNLAKLGYLSSWCY
jgi:hypothetical protein